MEHARGREERTEGTRRKAYLVDDLRHRALAANRNEDLLETALALLELLGVHGHDLPNGLVSLVHRQEE
jgi:hypothetical protein